MTSSFSPYRKGKGKHLCPFGHDMQGRAQCHTCIRMDQIAREAENEPPPPLPGSFVIRNGDGSIQTFTVGRGRPKRRRR